MRFPFFGRRQREAARVKGYFQEWLGETLLGSRPDIWEARRQYQVAVGDGTRSSVIMAAVLWAARRMAECPVGVKAVDDEAVDFNHPLARFFKAPNPFYSGSAMMMAKAVTFLTDGNAYTVKLRNKQGKPIQEMFIPPWAINPHAPLNYMGNGSDVFVDYYEYWPQGTKGAPIRLDPEDVVHLRYGIDPNNMRKGMSPLKILMREIYTDDEAGMFTAMMLKNSGIIGTILSPKEPGARLGTGEDDPATVKKYIQEEFRGVKRGDTMIMTGPTQVDYIGADAAKMDLGKLREVPEERVTAVLGIPAAVVGFGTGIKQTKVGATMSEMRALAYEDCLMPMQMLWCDEWDLQLMPEFEANPERFRAVFDLSGVRVLREDDNKLSDRLTRQLLAGGIFADEYRGQLGADVKLPRDHWRYIPMGLTVVNADDEPPLAQTAEQQAAADQARADAASQQGDQGDAGSGDPTTGGTPADNVSPKAHRIPTKVRMSAVNARLVRAMAKNFNVAAGAWHNALVPKFDEYGKAVADAFLKECARHGVKASEPDYAHLGDIAANETDLPDLEYGPRYLDIAKQTFGTVNTVLGLGVNLTDLAERRIIARGGKRMGLVDIAQQTRDAIYQAVSEARASGEGADAIARLIEEYVPGGHWGTSRMRSTMIARTEAKYAQNVSSLEAYGDSDNVTGIMVFDAQLGPTDEECEQLNGQVVSIDEAQALAESEHPNGTRSFAPVVGDGG